MSQPNLERLTFVTSRAMDFFSQKELTTQTGSHGMPWSPVDARCKASRR